MVDTSFIIASLSCLVSDVKNMLRSLSSRLRTDIDIGVYYSPRPFVICRITISKRSLHPEHMDLADYIPQLCTFTDYLTQLVRHLVY